MRFGAIFGWLVEHFDTLRRQKVCFCKNCRKWLKRKRKNGAPGEIRTPDLTLRRHRRTTNQQLSAICIQWDSMVSVRVFSSFLLAQTSQYKGPLGTKLGIGDKAGSDPLSVPIPININPGAVDDSFIQSL